MLFSMVDYVGVHVKINLTRILFYEISCDLEGQGHILFSMVYFVGIHRPYYMLKKES